MYELLSIQNGFNGSTFWFVGNTSTYYQPWPVGCYTSEEKAMAAIKKYNEEMKK